MNLNPIKNTQNQESLTEMFKIICALDSLSFLQSVLFQKPSSHSARPQMIILV